MRDERATGGEFAANLERGFERAAKGRPRVATLALGGRSIELRFANDALFEALAPALWLCSADGAPVTARIDIWDSTSTGVSPPAPPWPPDAVGPRGVVLGYEHGRYRAAFNIDSQTLSFLDTARGECHFWTRSIAALRSYERGAPLRTLLAWLASEDRLVLAHAGCVARGKRGILLVGNGGSGKSTTALSCVGSALDFVADDYCVLGRPGGEPRVFPLYTTGKLERTHLQGHLPALARLGQAGGGARDKVIVRPPARERALASVLLEAVVLPNVAATERATLEPSTAARALHAIGPSSLFQIPGLGAEALRSLADVVRQLPCHVLHLGRDPSSVPAVLSRLLPGGSA